MSSGAHALVEEAEARVPVVTVEELQREIEAGETIVLDVRDAEETWASGMIPGAYNISRGCLEWFADPQTKFHKEFMDPAKRVVTYSMGGERSSVAAMTLMDVVGYKDVADFRTGLRSWIAAGLEVAPANRPEQA